MREVCVLGCASVCESPCVPMLLCLQEAGKVAENFWFSSLSMTLMLLTTLMMCPKAAAATMHNIFRGGYLSAGNDKPPIG